MCTGCDCDDCSKGAAGRYADDAGVCHGVAEEALHDGAGYSERGAYGESQKDAWESDGCDDGLFGLRCGGLSDSKFFEQYSDGVRAGYRVWPDG